MSRALIATATALAVLAVGAPARAQTNTGQISGTVRDSQGGVLPGVVVTVTNVNTNITWTEVTGPQGTYTVTNLPIGSYTVTAEIQGFRKSERTGFVLSADGRITADFALSVGALTEASGHRDPRRHREPDVRRSAARRRRRDGPLAGAVGPQLSRAGLADSRRHHLDDDQMATTTGLGTGGTVINGNRGNSNSLTVDGGFNLDSGLERQHDQQRQHRLHRSGRDPDVELRRRQGPQRRRLDQRRHQERHQPLQRQPDGDLPRTTSSTRRITSRRGIPAATGSRPRKTSTTTAAALGGPIVKNKLFFFTGMEFKHARPPGVAAAPDAADPCRAAAATSPRGSSVPTALPARLTTPTFPTRSGTRPPACRSPTTPSRRACSRGWPGDRERLRPDDWPGGRVQRCAGGEQHDVPARFPVRLAAGPRARRLPAEQRHSRSTCATCTTITT